MINVILSFQLGSITRGQVGVRIHRVINIVTKLDKGIAMAVVQKLVVVNQMRTELKQMNLNVPKTSAQV